MIHLETLGGHLRVATEAMEGVESVCVGAWVGIGSRDEPAELSGVSHFLEHLLFKGTADRSAQQIAEELDAIGGECNAYTTREYTAFYIRLLAEDLDHGLGILCDILTAPALRAEDVETERTVMVDEILMHADEPADVVWEQLFRTMYGEHPMGRDVQGSIDSVRGIGRDDIHAFWDAGYRGANIVVAAAGKLDHDAIAAGVAPLVEARAAGTRPARTPPGAVEPAEATTARETEQLHVVLGMPALARGDDRRFALVLANHVLGGGMSSRLFQEVRERRGLAYGIGSDWYGHTDCGMLAVSVGTAPEHADTVMKLIREELAKMAAGGITTKELDVARGHVRAVTLLANEDPGARMSRIGPAVLADNRVLEVGEVLERFAAVTIDEVAGVAGGILDGPQVLSVVGPGGSR